MKQLWKKLVLCVLTLALCCNLVPMAFAADASYYNVYLEAQGGTCDVMQLYAYKYGSNYRLTSTPTPTMEGYKFDGWYDDVVGGTKITTRYNFKDDTTIYAHWTPTAKDNDDSTGSRRHREELEAERQPRHGVGGHNGGRCRGYRGRRTGFLMNLLFY